MATNKQPLQGISVVVTRPTRQAEALSASIKQHGGEAIVFPVIEITPPEDEHALLEVLRNLAEVDLLIFVSVNAVIAVTDLLEQHQLRIPDRVLVAAVGPKTAMQCEKTSIRVDVVPRERINSEGLLEELSEFDANGKNIIIFRGQDGREVLKQTLESRGARVHQVECYQRKVADISADAATTGLLERWRDNQIDMVMVSSEAILTALMQVLGVRNHALLKQTPILAYSPRVADSCRNAGAGVGSGAEIVVAENPLDEAAVIALVEWAECGRG